MSQNDTPVYPIDFLKSDPSLSKKKEKLISIISSKIGISHQILSIIDTQLTSDNLTQVQKKLIVKSYKNEILDFLQSMSGLQQGLHFVLQLDPNIFSNEIIKKFEHQKRKKIDKSEYLFWINKQIAGKKFSQALTDNLLQDFNKNFGTKYSIVTLYQIYSKENRKNQIIKKGGKIMTSHITSEAQPPTKKININKLTIQTLPEEYHHWILAQLKENHNQTDLFLTDRFREKFGLTFSSQQVRKMLLLIREFYGLKKSRTEYQSDLKNNNKLKKRENRQLVYERFKEIFLLHGNISNQKLLELYCEQYSDLTCTVENARTFYFMPLRNELRESGLAVSTKRRPKGLKKGYSDITQEHRERISSFAALDGLSLAEFKKSFLAKFDIRISFDRVIKELYRQRKELGIYFNQNKRFTPEFTSKVKDLILAGIPTNIKILEILGIDIKKLNKNDFKIYRSYVSNLRRTLGVPSLRGDQAKKSISGIDIIGSEIFSIEMKNNVISYMRENPGSSNSMIIKYCHLEGCTKSTVLRYILKLRKNGIKHLTNDLHKILEKDFLQLLKQGYSIEDLHTILGEKFGHIKNLDSNFRNICSFYGINVSFKKEFTKKQIKAIIFPAYDDLAYDTIPDTIRTWLEKQFNLRNTVSNTFLGKRFFETFGNICFPTYLAKMVQIIRLSLGPVLPVK